MTDEIYVRIIKAGQKSETISERAFPDFIFLIITALRKSSASKTRDLDCSCSDYTIERSGMSNRSLTIYITSTVHRIRWHLLSRDVSRNSPRHSLARTFTVSSILLLEFTSSGARLKINRNIPAWIIYSVTGEQLRRIILLWKKRRDPSLPEKRAFVSSRPRPYFSNDHSSLALSNSDAADFWYFFVFIRDFTITRSYSVFFIRICFLFRDHFSKGTKSRALLSRWESRNKNDFKERDEEEEDDC